MIKSDKILIACLFILLLPAMTGCKKFLKEQVYTEYDPSQFTATADGIQKLLAGAYSELFIIQVYSRDDKYAMNELTTDEMYEINGGLEATVQPMQNFTWDASNSFFSETWNKMYKAIRDANVLLDNIQQVKGLPADKLAEYTAEARFIRAASYVHLYTTFGTVPLITTAATIDLKPTRAKEDDLRNFIEAELTAAAKDLPPTADASGKATKGAALAVLCKFDLNIKSWQKSADLATQIIQLNQYQLFTDIANLCAVANNHNNEYIYFYPCMAKSGYGNTAMAHWFPADYPILTNQLNYAADFCLYTSLVNSFEPGDKRLTAIITQYTNTQGNLVLLNQDAQGKALNNARSFKFVPDPNAQSDEAGNYVPAVRYADILLSRAEALNELNGPTQESIDLINQVRQRAGISLLALSDFTGTDALRDELLQEREWEFYDEGLRREDLIRMNKFISQAVARGKNAKDYQVLFPIPQSEIQSNPQLTQNDGY